MIRLRLQGPLLALLLPLPAVAEPLTWQPLPGSPTPTAGEPNFAPLPADHPATATNGVQWQPVETPQPSRGQTVVWQPLPEGQEPLIETPAVAAIPLPPPPALQAMNRSIAFDDGSVGPDLGWQVPNGFRWTPHHWIDASVRGFSRREQGESFWAWNNGDGTAQLHVNVLQSGSWSVGLNSSWRSLYQGSAAAGGTTSVGEGFSTGFRIATTLGTTGGIAFGGEQIIQWDDKTDTGRNLYLMASKGWWLGNQGRDFPLVVVNGGFGTGRFAQNENMRFGCINDVQNRTGTYAIDNKICWGPIGSLSLAVNQWWGTFLEYNSRDAILGASMSMTSTVPIRFTWGVNFVQENKWLPSSEWNWVFRASLGF